MVEKSIHVIFYQSSNALQERVKMLMKILKLKECFRRLKIGDSSHPNLDIVDPKEERSILAPLPSQQKQEESNQDFSRY